MKQHSITVILAFLLLGCATGVRSGVETISMEELKLLLEENIYIENGETADFGESIALGERYGIPSAKIKEGFVYASNEMTDKADQIIVLNVKERSAVLEIEHSLEREVTNILNAWEGTDDSEYKKIKNCVLKAKGSYLFLAIADESKEAEKIFDSFFEPKS